MSKSKEKKTTKSKLASQKDIEFACEMICREFGFLKSLSFKISHKTIAHIIGKKSAKLEPEDYHNFLGEMSSHQYFVAVTEDHFTFFHASIAESLKEADSDIIECFEFCKENEIEGCAPNFDDSNDGPKMGSKKHIH